MNEAEKSRIMKGQSVVKKKKKIGKLSFSIIYVSVLISLIISLASDDLSANVRVPVERSSLSIKLDGHTTPNGPGLTIP